MRAIPPRGGGMWGCVMVQGVKLKRSSMWAGVFFELGSIWVKIWQIMAGLFYVSNYVGYS